MATSKNDGRARERAEQLLSSISPEKALPESSRIHRISAPDADVSAVATALASWYEQKRMTVQLLERAGVHTVQTRSASWRRAIGMATALTVVLHRDGGDLVVEIGAAPWVERAGVALVGTQLPVLLGTVAIGAWEQARLPEQSLQYVRSLLAIPPRPESSSTPGSKNPVQAHASERFAAAWRRTAGKLRQAVETTSAGSDGRSTPTPAPTPNPAVAAPPKHRLLDVNAATEEQLALLPLDPGDVVAILRARATSGGAFTSREEFERASGLKPHVVAGLRGLVTIAPKPASAAPPPGRREAPADYRRRVLDL